MSIDLVGKMGPRPGGDGNEEVLRLGREGALVVSDAHGRFFEAVSRGNCFSAANATAVASQAGLSAATPILTLYNPKDSGVLGVLMFAGVTQLVAFAAAAAIWLAANYNVAAADVTGTDAVPRNLLIGNNKKSALQAYLAATLPGVPSAIAVLGSGLTGAITTLPNVPVIGRQFDGGVVLRPGSAISIQTSTASGAAGLMAEYAWEEVPMGQ